MGKNIRTLNLQSKIPQHKDPCQIWQCCNHSLSEETDCGTRGGDATSHTLPIPLLPFLHRSWRRRKGWGWAEPKRLPKGEGRPRKESWYTCIKMGKYLGFEVVLEGKRRRSKEKERLRKCVS